METLVAMAILAGIVLPICTSMLLSIRMNAKAEQLLRDQIAVSSAVETLLAEGIDPEENYQDVFSGVTVATEPVLVEDAIYYNVEVSCGEVTVTTCIRARGEEGG